MQDNQIYVACLAAYNSGHLHGEWITPANDKDELQAQINKILKSSPIEDAEEWAVHDYNNFPNLGEYPGIENIIKVQEAIDEHDADVVSAFLENWSIEDLDHVDDAYYGKYSDFSEFAQSLADETMLIDCPQHIQNYFDYDKWERDLSHDYHEGDAADGSSLIFNSNW
tara:strand:- start:466 stop:969 length:504 start_codon:yes stop_codon:yes gene_type:complete